MTYEEFLNKQTNIYKDFEAAKTTIIKTGLQPKFTQNTSLSGYLIIYRHSEDIAQKASNFSQKVDTLVPSLIYRPEHIHTTVSDYLISDTTIFDKKILKHLTQLVNNVKSNFSSFEITYTKWLLNQNSIIARGHSDSMFFTKADLIINEAAKMGLALRYPYMSHITVSRFFESTQDITILESLIRLVDETEPLGTSKVNKLEVVFLRHHEGKIDLISGDTTN